MSVFVDTSALITLLDRDGPEHGRMSAAWMTGLESGEGFLTSNYVVLESCAVAQRRFGMAAVRVLLDEIVPLLHVEWIGEKDHAVGSAWWTASASPSCAACASGNAWPPTRTSRSKASHSTRRSRQRSSTGRHARRGRLARCIAQASPAAHAR